MTNKVKPLLDSIKQGDSEPDIDLAKILEGNTNIIEFGMFLTGRQKEAIERVYYNWFTFVQRRKNEVK